MNLKRRDFLKIMSLSVLAPGQLMNEHSLTPNNDPATSSLKSGAKHTQDSNQIDKLYKNAIVIDALLITRDWGEESSELSLNL